jgi:hypothetical protein
MSPQQVLILAFDAINLAKTMRASFKTAEVAGYFGLGLVTIPPDLAAQPVSVLVQDLVGFNRALVPILDLPQYSPDLFVDRARAPGT